MIGKYYIPVEFRRCRTQAPSLILVSLRADFYTTCQKLLYVSFSEFSLLKEDTFAGYEEDDKSGKGKHFSSHD